MSEELLTIAGVAVRLFRDGKTDRVVHQNTILRWIHDLEPPACRLPFLRMEEGVRVRAADLANFEPPTPGGRVGRPPTKE